MPILAPTVWSATGLAPAAVAGVAVGSGGGGGGPAPLTFYVPGSDAYAGTMANARRGAVGGSLARGWVAVTVAGTLQVRSFQHNGSRANPVGVVTALAGGNHRFVDLGSSTNTPSQVATALISSFALDSVTVTAGSADSEGRIPLTVTGGSGLIIPDAYDTLSRDLRGMLGVQRAYWGEGGAGVDLSSVGGTDGTGSMHLGALSALTEVSASRRVRILGAYCWGSGGYTPLLAGGTGGAYATDPTTITLLGQGVAPAMVSGGFSMVAFLDPPVIDSGDVLWWMYRGDTATAPGGPMYRLHSATPPGAGTLTASEQLCWDTSAAYATTDAFGSTYDPTNSANYAIYVAGGLIFEVEDDSGNFLADGAIDDYVGDQNMTPLHDTPFIADYTILTAECTGHKNVAPQLYSAPITEVTRAWEAIDVTGADREDSRPAIYQFVDVDIPSTGTHPLIQDCGPMGSTTANAFNTLVLSTPADIGTDALGTDSLWALFFNYVTLDGSALHTVGLPVYLDASVGDGSWMDMWVDDRRTWSDDHPGANEGAFTSGVTETRARNLLRGATTLPYVAVADTWPDPFDNDPTDDSPVALAADRVRIQRGGMVSA